MRYSTRSNFVHRLTACMAAGVFLTGCKDAQIDGPMPSVTEVGFVTIQPQSLILQSELAGRTVPSLISDVRPQVSGIIKARRFEEGAHVKAGQLLYTIDASVYAAALGEAEAALDSAKAALESARLKDRRYSELMAVEVVSKQASDDARAAHHQAAAHVAQLEAALATARINLGYTEVRAPISGRIGKSSVTQGALVTSNQEAALATIRVLDPIYVDMTQSSVELLRLRRMIGESNMKSQSAAVRLKLEDGTEYGRPGRMKFQEVAVDESTGSVILRAEFPNPEGILMPGMYVRAILDESVNPVAILAPQQGVTRDPKGNATALVISPDNKVEQRVLVTERTVGESWLVSTGLIAGDRLIVEGSSKVRVGDRVTPVDVGQGASPGTSAATVEPSSSTTGS